MPLRAIVALFLCVMLPGMARAGSALLRAPAQTPPQAVNVVTYSGKIPATVVPIQPSSSAMVVFLLDTLSGDELAAAKKNLLAAYTPARGAKLKIGLLTAGQLSMAGPFATRLRLKTALDQVRLPAEPAAPPSGADLVEVLFSNASQFGSEWSSVLFIGNIQPLESTSDGYATALLVRAFTTDHVRVSWFGKAPESWDSLFHSTCGDRIAADARDFQQLFDTSGDFSELDWTVKIPTAGFVAWQSVVQDAQGSTLLTVPELAGASETSLPSLSLYSQLRTKATEAKTILEAESLTQAQTEQLRDDLKISLGINPRDVEALLAAATLYERFSDYSTAAGFRASLVEVRPDAGDLQAALGHDYRLAPDLDKAETALQSALALGTRTTQIFEDLALIRIASKDDRAALPFLDEAIAGEPRRQDLWFLKANAATRLDDKSLAILAFERGLQLGGVHVEETSSLLRLYLETQQKEKARQLAQSTTTTLPADAAVREQFSAALDHLALKPEALVAWRMLLEVKPASQRAHERITRLLLESGDLAAAGDAADKGLAVAPASADLYLAKSEILEKQNYFYEARSTLERGAQSVDDKSLMERLATLEETFTGLGSAFYARWADLTGLSATEKQQVVERGLMVALRDGDYKQAKAFVARLESSGNTEARALLGSEKNTGDVTTIAGGLAALAFVARARERVSADRFFVEYSRALIDHAGSSADGKAGKQYIDAIQQYLEKVSALEAMGKRDAAEVHISLSLNGKEARSRTEAVLNLLGIKISNGKSGLELGFGEGSSQARKQETLGALGIDPVGMQEAFRQNAPFLLDIPYDQAIIYPNEKMWRDAFFGREERAGGFAASLLSSLQVARLYVGMSYLDRQTIAQLLASIDLKTLRDHYSELFYAFAPAFAIHNGHAVCPGGTRAEAVWERLAGASTRQPGAFFRALLERDEGKLLAFFFTVSHLDARRQAFFTADPSRTEQFYRSFVAFKDRQPGSVTMLHDTAFVDFLQSVPIASNGHVDFPGSPAVWMVAKGNAAAESKMGKLSKASSRYAGIEVEDEVLLRLAQARYREKGVQHTELDNFLAVARIDAHRSEPMDEDTALLLAQQYTGYSGAFAYFSDITALKLADYKQFFALLDQISAQSPLDANLRLGELHSLLEWICLLRQRDLLKDEEAAALFRDLLRRFGAANSSEAYAAASFAAADAILAMCSVKDRKQHEDGLLVSCFAGSNQSRRREFQQVLELQKVPSLETLLHLYRLAGRANATTQEYSGAEQAAAGLPAVMVPPKVKISGKERDAIMRYSPASVEKAVAQLAQRSGRAKANELEKLRAELIASLEPQVALVLAGVVYSYYLRPSDLLISEDPLLIRKHHFFEFSDPAHAKEKIASELHASSEGAGSYFSGGFSGFPIAAGEAASSSWKSAGHGGTQTIAVEVASIRATPWDLLTESDLRLLGVRITVAREWIVESALRPEVFEKLSEATPGMISLSRRADLLNGISGRNWDKVWASLTLPDLFLLGSSYTQYFASDSWSSSSVRMLRSLGNDGFRLRSLGAVLYRSFGCGHTHWMPQGPYEEYERRFFPLETAERWAEFKLYLAFQTDLAGGNTERLAPAAEKLAAKAFAAAQMADFGDWRSLQLAFGSITVNDIKRALQQ